MKKYLKLISRSTKMKCLGAIAMAFGGSMLGSIWPVRLGALYTRISKGEIHSIAQGSMIIGIFGGIYLAAEVINIARRVFMDCIIVNHETEIRQKSIEKMLKRPIKDYCGDKISGEQTAQMNQGVTGLSQLIKITCNDVLATVLTAICTLLQVLLNAPGVIAFIMLIYLLITLIISIFQIRSQNGIRELIISRKNKLDGQVCQSISNIELIRSMNAEEYEVKRLTPDINAISRTEKYHHKYMGVFDCLKQACKIVFQVMILFLSIYLIGAGYMEAGTVITVCLLFQQLIKPIDEVYRFMDETASAIVKAKELINVIGKESNFVHEVGSKAKKEKSPDIILKKVVVESPDETKKLAYYDYLHIPGKKMVAIKGESGSGKTTLMRCLSKFYSYSSGEIELFGNDLNSYSQEELSNDLFCVPQKTYLFAGSVRENLLYGLKCGATDEELIEALRKACLLETLIDKAKDENLSILDYYIGEGGNGLSGGEAQRLSIARALLRSPKVYFFDESTSALDEMTTKEVLENIKSHALSIDAGVIIIAHTRNVMESCDIVIELQNKIKFYKETKHFEKFA